MTQASGGHGGGRASDVGFFGGPYVLALGFLAAGVVRRRRLSHGGEPVGVEAFGQGIDHDTLARVRAQQHADARRTPLAPAVATEASSRSAGGWQDGGVAAELLYLRDAYVREFEATVTSVDAAGRRVLLDRTVFYPTGGGQPHDTGTLGGHPVVDVRKDGDDVWHTIGGDGALPAVGDRVHGELDWERRYALMRTHTALHVLCGVIWNEWGKAVTGGNMEPLSARMDFEFDPLPEGFGGAVEELVNLELAKGRLVGVAFLPRGTALADSDLIRTKVNLVPETVSEIRVVDIVGLDKQADGGTHVRNTAEVGAIRVLKTESKGKGNKRIRLQVENG
ncbi:MAG: alanyl-tRNA editing protein [Acidimicrobiales bacterium]